MGAFLLISRGRGALCTASSGFCGARVAGLDVIREAVQPSLKVCAVAIPRSNSSIAASADKLASSSLFFSAGSSTGKLSVESRAGQRTHRCLGADAPLRSVTSAHDFLPSFSNDREFSASSGGIQRGVPLTDSYVTLSIA